MLYASAHYPLLISRLWAVSLLFENPRGRTQKTERARSRSSRLRPPNIVLAQFFAFFSSKTETVCSLLLSEKTRWLHKEDSTTRMLNVMGLATEMKVGPILVTVTVHSNEFRWIVSFVMCWIFLKANKIYGSHCYVQIDKGVTVANLLLVINSVDKPNTFMYSFIQMSEINKAQQSTTSLMKTTGQHSAVIILSFLNFFLYIQYLNNHKSQSSWKSSRTRFLDKFGRLRPWMAW